MMNTLTQALKQSSYICFADLSLINYSIVRCMAGHSKWANIKHNKEAQDRLKGATTDRILKQIKLAIKEGGGGADPNINGQLARTLALAKSNNVPKTTIDKVLAQAKNSNDNAKKSLLDYRGANGVFLIASILTDNPKRCRSSLNALGKKFALADSKGDGSRLFEEKGILIADAEGKDLDVALEHAIEYGAEDVVKDGDILKFTCHPHDLLAVKSGLDECNYDVTYASVDYIPKMVAEVSSDQQLLLDKAVETFETQDYVIAVYTNVE